MRWGKVGGIASPALPARLMWNKSIIDQDTSHANAVRSAAEKTTISKCLRSLASRWLLHISAIRGRSPPRHLPGAVGREQPKADQLATVDTFVLHHGLDPLVCLVRLLVRMPSILQGEKSRGIQRGVWRFLAWATASDCRH